MQRNRRTENAQLKAGEVPADWPDAKRRQKDVEACWTQKHGVSHYGYKNHVRVDREHKSIRRWQVSEAALRDDGWRSGIHRKGQKDNPLSDRAQAANHRHSTVRARVEHLSAQQ